MLFDPGTLASGFEELTGLDAILVTHQHPDHVDPARLPALVAANPNAARYCDPQTAAQFTEHPEFGAWSVVRPGQTVRVGSLTVRGTGGRHAVIHPELPVVDNISYILDTDELPGAFCHPGDALYIPFEKVDVLAIPAAAPWLKLSEPIDYLRAVNPRVAFPIHQGPQSAAGIAVHNSRLADMAPDGTDFRVLEAGVPTTV
ncbi:hypothetical protein MP11Mi_22990 [Gordonia sp. MP11Mi]|uniref:MBL fold metallo-hydrolase n=1 Tax=Gordonia sp. MP11Mi TaxID=3022769 RepID=A0AA97CVD5_9ACTN